MLVTKVLGPIVALASTANALDLDINDDSSIISASSLLVGGLMDYYTGNQTGQSPGMFSAPYYWWEAGVAWGTMLDHWYFTGNDSYNDLIHSSMLYQSGDYWNYMTYNQTSTEGNDDQGFWGITAMTAAEWNFTAPGKGYPDTWLYFAQATFNIMASRWEPQDCYGGLRWQIFTWNAGYNYKNLVANGCLFNLAARLYRYTGNETFYDWSEKIFDWLEQVQFLNNTSPDDPTNGYIYGYDGAAITDNCSTISPAEWTYNYGLMMSGSAAIYNVTQNQTWLDRTRGLWNRGSVFFTTPQAPYANGSVMYEAACQPLFNSQNQTWGSNRCNNDQRCFKGIYAKFLTLTMMWIPETHDWIWPHLTSTAAAAARSCSGGTDGHTCGLNWLVSDGWDGMYGLGEQISALGVLNTLMYTSKPGPLTADQIYGTNSSSGGANGTTNGTGSTVYGYPDAGLNTSTVTAQTLALTSKDTAGAGVLTAVVLLLLIGSTGWLLF